MRPGLVRSARHRGSGVESFVVRIVVNWGAAVRLLRLGALLLLLVEARGGANRSSYTSALGR